MDENNLTLEDYVAIFRRRKWQLILPAVVLAALAIAAALLLPPSYRSTATILIERQEIPSELVQTTVTSFADQRIQVISQRVMTTSNLGQLIERYDLYQNIRRRATMNEAVERMKKDISLDMISADVLDPQSGRAQEATIAFSLSFEGRTPELAQTITSDLVSLFLNENLEQRVSAANEATSFLQTEVKRLGDEIGTLEARLAVFKSEHADNLPELAAINREQMMRTEQHLLDNAQSLRTLEQQAISLEADLAQMSPSSMDLQSRGPQARLLELEAQYARIKDRYSRAHPDRVQMEREIASLKELVGESPAPAIQSRLDRQKMELAELRKRYSEEHPDVLTLKRSIAETERQLASARRSGRSAASVGQVDNPAYIQLRARLEGTQIEIRSLKQARDQMEKELAKFEERLAAAPRIEQDYRALTRDYDNAMLRYKEMKEKALQAQLAQSLERDRKSERFSLIEPPLLPDKPSKPNRLAIMVLGVMLSAVGGFGNLALRESMDKGLYGPKAIQAAADMPVLAVIPTIEIAADRKRKTNHLALWIGGGVAVVLLVAGLVHFFFMPLDVLWFSLMRRLNMALVVNLPPSSLEVGSLWNA